MVQLTNEGGIRKFWRWIGLRCKNKSNHCESFPPSDRLEKVGAERISTHRPMLSAHNAPLPSLGGVSCGVLVATMNQVRSLENEGRVTTHD